MAKRKNFDTFDTVKTKHIKKDGKKYDQPNMHIHF